MQFIDSVKVPASIPATDPNLDVKSVRLILALQSDPIYPPAHKEEKHRGDGREAQSGFENHIKKALSQIPKIQ